MAYRIRNKVWLKKILMVDCIMGCGTALLGLTMPRFFSQLFGLPVSFLDIVCTITLVYGVTASILARQQDVSITWLRILVWANWLWTGVSVVLLYMYAPQATGWGIAFLIAQVLVVGGLAWLEGREIVLERDNVY